MRDDDIIIISIFGLLKDTFKQPEVIVIHLKIYLGMSSDFPDKFIVNNLLMGA